MSVRSRTLRRTLAVTAVIACSSAFACQDPAIRLTYRPSVGTRSSYELTVKASSTTRLDGEPTESRHDSFILRSDQEVKDAEPGTDAQVAVRLSGSGQETRNFVVRLDRSGQLATVESVEGQVPSAALGDLGISEILPSAAGALPTESLRPGDRWKINQSLRIGEEPAGQLVGWGRLASLGVSDGTKQAVVDTEVALPVDRTTTTETGGTIHLVGSVRTVMKVTQRVKDGVVLGATARSVGRYKVTLSPPTIDGGPPVEGTLTVIISSTTKTR